MSDELTPADWQRARQLLTMNDVQLHKLDLEKLREAAQLLRFVSDLCKQRSRALHKFADGREAIGEQP